MTWKAAFGLSLLIGAPVSLLWFVLRGMFPRSVEEDPMADAHGDVPSLESERHG